MKSTILVLLLAGCVVEPSPPPTYGAAYRYQPMPRYQEPVDVIGGDEPYRRANRPIELRPHHFVQRHRATIDDQFVLPP